jgi:hypothetical protein
MSPGRTGATLIVRNLNSIPGNNASVEHRPLMIPSLDPRFKSFNNIPKDTNNLVPVLSRRRSILDSIISLFIMDYTKEAQTYTDKKLPKFHIEKEKFVLSYMYYLNFYDQIDLSHYQHDPITVYFEDMFEDPKYLFKCFDIDKEIDYNLCDQSPYGSELIANYDELKEICAKQRWDQRQ